MNKNNIIMYLEISISVKILPPPLLHKFIIENKEIYLPLLKAGESDRLEDTINYEDIISVVTKAFTEKQYALVEAAAQSVCDRLLNDFKIDKITVRVRKPHAPIDADFETVEVQLNRKNEENK